MQKRDPRKKKYWCPLEFGARTWGAKSQRSPVFSAEGPRHLLGARAGGEKHSGSKARTHTHCRATEPAFWPPPLPDVTSPCDKHASPRAQLDPPALGTPVGLPPLWGRWICSGRFLEGPPVSSRRRPGPPAVSRCVFPTGAMSAAFSVTDTSRAPRPAPFALVCPSSRLGFPWLVAVSFPLLPKSGLVLRLYPFLLFPRSLV